MSDELSQRKFKNARNILVAIEQEGFEARFAGGCVRDRIIGIEPKDYDIATTALPKEICSIFEQKNQRVIPTGIEHGTVTVISKTGPIEITTLRKDIKTDGRHAEVLFGGTSFKDDAQRRDFTINAMFEDKDQKVYDFFNGQKDLEHKILRFVGDPYIRIEEDYLRIMRFFRFWARFGFKADSSALNAIADLCTGLENISQERITSELLQMLCYETLTDPLHYMHKLGIWDVILGEIKWLDEESLEFVHGCSTIAHKSLAIARLAALIHFSFDKERCKNIARRLKLSGTDEKLLTLLVTAPNRVFNVGDLDSDAMEFVDFCEQEGGKKSFEQVCLIYWLKTIKSQDLKTKLNSINAVEQKSGYLRTAKLPLNGHEVMKILDVKEGAALGKIMVELKQGYRNGKWSSKDQGIEFLEKFSKLK